MKGKKLSTIEDVEDIEDIDEEEELENNQESELDADPYPVLDALLQSESQELTSRSKHIKKVNQD